MEKLNVLVMAGGGLPESLMKYNSGIENRAFLKIGDRYMIEYVIDTLRAVPEVDRILVVGLKDQLKKTLGDRVDDILPAKDSMFENLRMGVNELGEGHKVLIATCDSPLLTPEMVSRFIAKCGTRELEAYYPLINKKDVEAKYPTNKRTYFKLKEGTFTGGNLFVLDPVVLRKHWTTIEKGLASRKSPVNMFRIIGIGFIFKYLFGMLSADLCASKVREVFGVNGAAVFVDDPEVGIDVDKESDYILCVEVLTGKKPAV